MLTLTPPITFRGWSTASKTMLETRRLPYNAPYVVNMQTTGLKDANGKIIFAGDIIKPTNALPKNIRERNTHIIAYELGCFITVSLNENCPEAYKKFPFSSYRYTSKLESFEVVGNVFENPDLVPESIRESILYA